MKGKIKKNQTMKSNTQNKTKPKKLNSKKRNKNVKKIKCMFWRIVKWNLSQLLVLTFWLLSGSVFGLLTAPGYLLLTLNLPRGFCCSFWMLQADVVCSRFFFPFLWFLQDDNSVWATIFTGAQKLDHFLKPHTIINSKCSKNLNIRPESIKTRRKQAVNSFSPLLAIFFFAYVSLRERKKRKSKEMKLCQCKKVLHSKGNAQQNKWTTYWMGENSLHQYI